LPFPHTSLHYYYLIVSLIEGLSVRKGCRLQEAFGQFEHLPRLAADAVSFAVLLTGHQDRGLCLPPSQCSGTRSVVRTTTRLLLISGKIVAYNVWSERHTETAKYNVHALATVIEASCGDSHGYHYTMFRRHQRWWKGDASHNPSSKGLQAVWLLVPSKL
jgi:hypothetical protein